jgi:hypothetical protein
MIQRAGGRRQAAGCGMVAAVVFACLLLGACSSTPSYPDPGPDRGQILVSFRGEPRDGVRGPKFESVILDYGTARESIEQGESFERVDYNEIEDVVVLLTAGQSRGPLGFPADTPIGDGPATVLTVTDRGFDKVQVATGVSPQFRRLVTRLTIRNQRGEALTIYGLSDEGGSFEVAVPGKGEATVTLMEEGVYEVFCDEDESLQCTWYAVISGLVWSGSSDRGAFFDNLDPGPYHVTVYAPRLPVWTGRANVKAGMRETLTAGLSVNDLPEVGE